MKKLYLIIITIFILGPVFAFNVKDVFACTSVYRTSQESFDSADAVFVGKVTSFATSTEVFVYDGTNVPTHVSSINLQVQKYWKGSLS